MQLKKMSSLLLTIIVLLRYIIFIKKANVDASRNEFYNLLTLMVLQKFKHPYVIYKL